MVTNACEQIENDEFFKYFLKDDEAGPVVKKTNEFMTVMSITDQINKLSDGLELISTELQGQVKEQHSSLLKQAANQSNLHQYLDTVSEQVAKLQAGANQLKAKIGVPYHLLENQTKVLRNLHEASHLLRQISRFLQLHKRLQATASDLPSQAKILYELEPLLEDENLKKVTYLIDEKSTIITTRQKLLNIVTRDLATGLQKSQLELVVRSLQIFANLQTLNTTITNQIDAFINNDIKHSLKACFTGTDLKILQQTVSRADDAAKKTPKGPGKTPTLTTSQHFRTKLWTALEWLFDEEIFDITKQVMMLQRAIEQIKQSNDQDRITAESIRSQFVTKLEALLKTSFEGAAPHVGQCLQQGLPRLLSAVKSLERKLEYQYKFSATMFASLEAGYIEKCGTNLKTPLNGIDFPNQDVVENLVRNMRTELSAAVVDDALLLLVAGAVNAVNKDFWNKVEVHVKLGTDAKQVFDVPGSSQLQNRELANTIYYHQVAVTQMVNELGPKVATSDAAKKIITGLNDGKTIVLAILQQLIDSFNSAVNIILLSIHREPGLGTQNIATSGPSLYMKELIDFLHRNWTSHIVPFNDKSLVEQCGKELAKNCIDLFINNIAVVRPLSNAGRQRIKSDCQHLETALRPVVPDLSVLGKQFRLLRSVCHMITLTPENLIQSTVEEGIVPSYIILFLLFGHAKQTELASPHQAADWSNEKLVQWLDGHTSDRERLELVGGALQKYRVIVRQKNIAKYDPVYPIILEYWEKVTKQYQS